MINMTAYVCMGQLHVSASYWGKVEGGRTQVTHLGGGVVDLDPELSYDDDELLHLMCEVGLDISSDTWVTRGTF